MKWSFKIASVWGIPIELHVTFVLLLALVLYLTYPLLYDFFFVVFLFVFVVIHELSHSAVAKHYNVKVRKIVLYPIGGASEIEEIPDNPRVEWRMSIAGPLTSFAIAGLLYFLRMFLSIELPASVFPPDSTVFGTGSPMIDLALLNMLLGLFNLIPAFPMDGGRVLRALLAERMNFVDATRRAASIGKVFGLFMAVYGFLFNLWFTIIGVFIYVGATEEAESTVVSTTLASIRVRDVMNEKVASARPETTLSEALEIMFRARYHDILVEDDGVFHGIVTWKEIMKVKPKDRILTALEKMRIRKISAFSDDSVLQAYKIMAQERIDLIPVVEKEKPDKVIGVLTSEGVAYAYEKAKDLR